ncbi:hypothetical protein BDF14DRAFT_509317 [Spinellus fusiger]|nr:hypothetical protein BDF14DRAFT_509317 [Spinellus fusiger]
MCEEATWTLVSLLAEAQTHSPSVVWHYFNIKQWLEKSTVATAMAYSDSEDDQEHEIPDTNLNKKKRHLKRALAKRRRISVHASLDEFEAFNKSLLRHLRHHRLEKALEESEAKEEPWRKALLRAYADTMDRVKGQSVHWTADGRTAWRETCHALANQVMSPGECIAIGI